MTAAPDGHRPGNLSPMDAGDWGWIWMVAFVVFLVGELATPGAFFLIGFAIGALFAICLLYTSRCV